MYFSSEATFSKSTRRINKHTNKTKKQTVPLIVCFSISILLFVVLPPAQLSESLFAELHDPCYALFVSAGLFLAVLTRQGCVCVLSESLRVELIHYLPQEQEHDSETE